MRCRGGEFSTGTKGNFQPELTVVQFAESQLPFASAYPYPRLIVNGSRDRQCDPTKPANTSTNKVLRTMKSYCRRRAEYKTRKRTMKDLQPLYHKVLLQERHYSEHKAEQSAR